MEEPTGDVARGVRQALLTLVVCAVLALAGAGVWAGVQGGEFLPKLGIALVVVAALVGVTGGTEFSRAVTTEAHAFLGWGPDREERDSGSGLTAVGVFLLVSLPLAVGGLVLAGLD